MIWIGKTRDSGLAKLSDDLVGRIRRFLPIDILELKDPKTGDARYQLQEEAGKILSAVDESDRIVVLDAGGQMWTSQQFSRFLGSHLRNDPRRLTFIVGGYGGIADSVKKRADKIWSLSPLTFTHEMARVLVLEQVYRALAILKNLPYAK